MFTSLSIDATIRGVAKARNLTPEALSTLATDQRGAMALSPDAKILVETYQTEDLGISDKVQSFGKTNWKTMRSLEGGMTTKASDWELPTKNMEKFDARALNLDLGIGG